MDLEREDWKHYSWLAPPLLFEDIRKTKSIIDEDNDFLFRVFFSATWSPESLSNMREKLKLKHHVELSKLQERQKIDEWRANQVKRFFVNLARKEKVHLKTYSALSPVWEIEHFHAVISSTKPIRKTYTRQCWKHGKSTDWKKYDSQYGRKFNGNDDSGCVFYIFSKHHPIMNKKGVFHPNKKRCRKGICEICNREGNNGK